MKKGIHPENYRPVVFKDMSNGDVFLSRSTCSTKETIESFSPTVHFLNFIQENIIFTRISCLPPNISIQSLRLFQIYPLKTFKNSDR